MRDLMFLGAMFFLVPLAFSNTFIALMIWGWTALVAIDNYLYGFMGSVRLNLIFALLTLTLILLKRDPERGKWEWTPAITLLCILLGHTFLSASLGYSGNARNWELFELFAKTALFALVMPLAVTSRYRIHAFVIVICLGMGFHGLIDGLKFISSGGGHIVRGFRKFGDNNHFAVLLTMAIPLMLYLSRYAQSKIVRFAAIGSTLVTIGAVIGTRSRGGFVALSVVGIWYLVTSRQRVTSLFVVALAILAIAPLAPDSWRERMETIGAADEDSSFMQRVEAWQVSSTIAIHNPVFGGGFHAVQVQSVWDQFRGQKGILGFVTIAHPADIFRAAHSIYFETMGDQGFVGFLLFMTLWIRAFVTGMSVSRAVKPLGADWQWAGDLGRALASVVLVFMVGGLTVSIAYSELILMVIVLIDILRKLVDGALASNKKPAGTPLTGHDVDLLQPDVSDRHLRPSR